MGTIDANGIYMYADTDPLVPFASLLNTGQASVSAKFASIDQGLVHYVANTTERAALAATFMPTASKPLYVHRANVTDGRNLEFTTDGTNWITVASYQKATVANWPNLTSNTTTPVNLPALATTVPVVAGTTYKIEWGMHSYGGANDLVNLYLFINGTQVTVTSGNANNSLGAGYTIANRLTFFYTATATTTITINARFSRGSGTGTITTNNSSSSAYGPGYLEVRSV